MPHANWQISGSFGNIPNKHGNKGICGVVCDRKITIVSHDRDKDSGSDLIICEFMVDGTWTNRAIAEAIANAITAARDIGFEQGREYVRKALGL